MEEQISFIPYDQAYAVGFEDMNRRVPDTSKLNEYIQWEAFTLEETADIFQQFRGSGY